MQAGRQIIFFTDAILSPKIWGIVRCVEKAKQTNAPFLEHILIFLSNRSLAEL